METTVMVGEKPKVASRIANALGNYDIEENRGVKNYIIDAGDRQIIIAPAVGHIFNLEQISEGWDYPVFDVEWRPIFETNDESDYVKKYYNNLRDQLEKADTYINACDYDIEGCIPDDERVVVKEDGEIRTVKAKDLVKELFSSREISKEDGREFVSVEDVQILGQDDWQTGFHPLEKAIRRQADSKLLEIRLSGGRKAEVSKNHPMLVAREKGLDAVPAEEVEEGDFVLGSRSLPGNEAVEQIDLIDQLDGIYVHGFKKNMQIMPAQMCKLVDKTRKQCLNYRFNDRMPKKYFLELEEELGIEREELTVSSERGSTRLDATLELDYQLGRFIGLYLAEGCIDSGGFVGLYFGPEEDELVKEVQEFLQSVGIEEKTRKRTVEGSMGSSECYEVGTKSKILRKLLQQIDVGKDSHSKALPDWILSAKKEFKEGLISGYWDGDGSLFIDSKDDRAIAGATSVSRELLDDLFLLLQTDGINATFQTSKERGISNITIGRREDVTKLSRLLEASEEVQKALRETEDDKTHLSGRVPKPLAKRQELALSPSEVRKRDTFSTDQIENWERGMKGFKSGSTTFLQVKEVEETNYEGEYLYDLQTENRNYLHGNGIISHNSTIGGTILKHIAEAPDEKIQRMKFSTLTPSELQDAFDDLEEFDRGMTEAGITRHKLDFFYGINVSRALMKAVQENDRYQTLSTGRVQGPTLKILADREREIMEFEPDPYWEVFMNHAEFQAKLQYGDEDRIWDEDEANGVFLTVKGEDEAEVSDIDINNYKHNPPIPFNLTGLQSEASSQFRISPKRTQSIAQSLYESGLISYPRTESQKLPAKLGYKNLLKKLKNQDKYEDKAKKVLKKNDIYPRQGGKEDDAHPAIYPTGESPGGSLSKQERQVYDLIVKRFFAVFGDAAKRQTLTMTLTAEGYDFQAKAKKTVERNWFELYDPYVKVSEVSLPELEEGDTIPVESFELEEKETKPPRRYSQSSIVNELEKRNLGTKCLTEDQEILMKTEKGLETVEIGTVANKSVKGQITLSKLEGNRVVSLGRNFGESEFAGISSRDLEEDEKILEVQLRDGSSVKATSDHPVMVAEDGNLGYKRIENLEPEDSLFRAHRASVVSTETVEFEEFLEKVDGQSSLYGDLDLERIRNERDYTLEELAQTLKTGKTTVLDVQRRGRGLLRYWKELDIDEPEYLTSENFDLKIENPFPLKISPALLRLVGFLQGDGSFDSSGKESENKVDFRYHNTNPELAEQFQEDVQRVFGVKLEIKSQEPSSGTKTRYYVQLPAVIGRVLRIATDGFSQEWIQSKDHTSHYVGALIADEGHVSTSEPKAFISNIEEEILQNCKEELDSHGIESKLAMDQYRLKIRSRRNLELLLENIPIPSTRKHQNLIEILERHYKYGEERSSPEKERTVLEAIEDRKKTVKSLANEIDLTENQIKYILDRLREKGYVRKRIEGISERPRKKIYYETREKIQDTFYSEIGEEAVGTGHTASIESIEEKDYNGKVFDILNTDTGNFLTGDGIVVHNSTRAKTVDRLYNRDYIDGEPIEVMDLGLAIVDTLEEHCPNVLSEDLTRSFEEKMQAIREGKETSDEVVGEAEKELTEILKEFKENEKEIGAQLVETIDVQRKKQRQLGLCEVCEDGTMRVVKTDNGRFAGCNNYPDCENTYPLPSNGKIEALEEQCDECGTPRIKVIRKGRKPYSMCIDPECPTKDDW